MLTMLLLATQTVAPKMLSIKQANIVIYTNQKKSKKKENKLKHTHTTGHQENINDIYRISSTLRLTHYSARNRKAHSTVDIVEQLAN